MKRTRKGQNAFERRNDTPTVSLAEYSALCRYANGFLINSKVRRSLISKGLIGVKRGVLMPSAWRVMDKPKPNPPAPPISINERHQELLRRVREQFGSPTERYHRSPITGTRAGVWG